MAHKTKSSVKQHIDHKSHQRNQETFEKREAKRKVSATAECNIPAKMQRVATLKQPLLAHVVNSAAAKYNIADDTVCLGTRIPPENLYPSLFRKWLQKYNDINGSIPTLSGNFPEFNIIRLNDGMQLATKGLLDALRAWLRKEAN